MKSSNGFGPVLSVVNRFIIIVSFAINVRQGAENEGT